MSNNTPNINKFLQPGTILRNPPSVGVNISEIVITQNGIWIDKNPDCVVFEINEANTSIPPKGTLCMFCKNKPAIHSVKKMESTEGQFAGWHYCADCKTKY